VFAIFVFAQPLEIDRTVIFSEDFHIEKNSVQKVLIPISTKKLLLKPRLEVSENEKEKSFFEIETFTKNEIEKEIFKPPI
jgi:hypothetical protein